MWNYEKRLQYPVNIKNPNAKLAQIIMSQYGGPNGSIALKKIQFPVKIKIDIFAFSSYNYYRFKGIFPTIIHKERERG